jgi:long-chain acyl-CoA synthetase
MLSTNLDNLQEELRAASPHYVMNVPVLLERIKNGVEGRVTKLPRAVRSLYERGAAAHRASVGGQIASTERMWLMLARRMLFPRIKRLIGENLEFLVCGSARLSEDTQRWFEMVGLPVFQVYGLTETTGIVTIDDTKNVQPGRVGYAVAGCELRLTEEGELACRGPNVFAGYWNRPEATAQMVVDGWLHTGDQAEIDASGSVRIVGRLKDVIVPASGHNVAPAAIEERLLQAGGGLEQAVVIGHGRAFLTAIVTGPVTVAALDETREKVNAALPHYQRLRKIHLATEPFSPENGLLTANQKLRRAQIESRYADAIEEMYR